MKTNERAPRREPIRAIGIAAARTVRKAIGYARPTELEIEVLAYMRGALVRASAAGGARANLVRLGSRGVIGVAGDLSHEERRWAIAHELGHFEAHAGVSFLGLCANSDLILDYEASGREPEANAFAAELLMPEDLFAPGCDVPKLAWQPLQELARSFEVSLMAAAIRFLSFTAERAAVVCVRDGVIAWSSATRDFGLRPRRGERVDEWTEAHAYFRSGECAASPQTVSASAWIPDAEDDEDLQEHVFAMPKYRTALSLLFWKE